MVAHGERFDVQRPEGAAVIRGDRHHRRRLTRLWSAVPLYQRAGAHTDVVAGIEAGLHTVLVMTGISDPAEIERYPFRPDEVLTSVAELIAPEPIESEMPEGI